MTSKIHEALCMLLCLLILMDSGVDCETSFLNKTTLQAQPLTNLRYYDNRLFVGGSNLYALNMNLTVIATANISSINKVLVVNDTNGELFVCELDGTCQFISSTNLMHIRETGLQVSKDLTRPAQALITTSKSSDKHLLIAVTYGDGIDKKIDDRGNATYKMITREMYDADPASLNFIFHKDSQYLIYFKDSFQHGGYSYLVTNQLINITSKMYSSKIIRLCQNGTGLKEKSKTQFFSYVDTFITCKKDGKEYNLIQNALLVELNGVAWFVGTFVIGNDPVQISGESVVCKTELTNVDEFLLEEAKSFALCQHNIEFHYVEDQRISGMCSKPANASFQIKDIWCNQLITNYAYAIGIQKLALNSSYSIEGLAFVTSLHTAVVGSNTTVLLAGTSTGDVIMMNINETSVEQFETIRVAKNQNITGIYQHSDSDLFIMTGQTIYKYRSTNCSEFDSCSATMLRRNPLCGWCLKSNRATRQADCPAEYWQHSHGECYSLNLQQKGVRVSTVDNVNIIVQPELPKTETEYKCIFKVKSNSTTINETVGTRRQSEQIVICSTPFVGQHTESVLELVMVSNGERVKLGSTDFLFFNCGHFNKTSCKKCVHTTGVKCSWSLLQTDCIFASSNSSSLISQVEECPQMGNNSDANLIASYVSKNVTFKGDFPFETTQLKFWCYVDGTHIPAEYEYNTSSITCQLNLTTLVDKDHKPVQVKYGMEASFSKPLAVIDDSYSNNVTVYNCSKLAAGCHLCKGLKPDRYTCFWGSSSCRYGNKSLSDMTCPQPTITDFDPKDGPVNGDTRVTISGREFGSNKDTILVTVAGENCSTQNIEEQYFKCADEEDFTGCIPTRIVCSTKGNMEAFGKLNVTVPGFGNSSSNGTFAFKQMEVTSIYPDAIIKSGGVTVTVFGNNLGVGNKDNIWIKLGTQDYKEIAYKESSVLGGPANVSLIFVTKPITVTTSITKLEILSGVNAIATKNDLNLTVVDDPTLDNITPKGFLSGGTRFNITGTNLNYVQVAKVWITYDNEKREEPCEQESATKIICKAPVAPDSLKQEMASQGEEIRRRKRSAEPSFTSVDLIVKLDGREYQFQIKYYNDPALNNFTKEIIIDEDKQQKIEITGKDLNLVATKQDVKVTIGLAECELIEITETNITCFTPESAKVGSLEAHIHVTIGNIQSVVGTLIFVKQIELVLIAGSVGGGLVFIIIILVIFGTIKYKRVGKKYAREYQQRLTDMEMEIKRVAREEFLDMHTTMSNVNRNLVEQGFPYHTYQQYACNIMFSVDYLWTEPVMADEQRANKGMDMLESLIFNKFFLTSVIATMEKEKRFFIREKSNLAGNLCAVLMGRMEYLEEILKVLLTNLVQGTQSKKHKSLFRRCESITEKLLSNWISLCLYPHFKTHSGSPLYLLFMAIQKTMEEGPIDAVSGKAKYTLCEDKLLTNWSASADDSGPQDLKMEAKMLTLNVVVDNGQNIYKCRVLDCDTISQVKSKCMGQIYMNYPASQIHVNPDELALEWHEGFGGALKLKDEDNTTKQEGHWIRLNTLAHYNVKDDSNMALVDPHSTDDKEEDYVNLTNVKLDGIGNSSADFTEPLAPREQEHPVALERWHLVKQEETGKQGKSAIAELYLNRLLKTKQCLMEYIRILFEIILDKDHCPPPTKSLFDFLDSLGDSHRVDADTLHHWKSHSYAIRVWGSLMRMPALLFDVTIPSYMEQNLEVISQVFIESFSLSSQKFTKDSPPQKLIFHSETNQFRDRVNEFYKNVKVDSQNPENLRQYMDDVNKLQQQSSFNKVSALYRLYKQLKPYMDDILEDLAISKEASSLQLDKKLEKVIEIMEEEGNAA